MLSLNFLAFLVITVFWQQVVFGRPARQTRALKDCKPDAKLKQTFSKDLQTVLTNMQGLFSFAVVSNNRTNNFCFIMLCLFFLHDKRENIEFTLVSDDNLIGK